MYMQRGKEKQDENKMANGQEDACIGIYLSKHLN